MRRVSVVGTSGSGKSTLARALAKRLAVPYVELDAFMHQPGWVVDGNYRRFVIEGPVWKRADTVVWLDLPRRTVMRQVIVRTIRRAVTREELWNGNREPLANFVSLDPDKNVIVWAWVKHDEFVQRYLSAMLDPAWLDLNFVRLRSRAETRRWLTSIDPAQSLTRKSARAALRPAAA